MVGPGTGIAPFIGFMQQKQILLEKGIDRVPGQYILYFGCRHENGDFIFKEEIQKQIKNGVLQKFYPAFSRDQNEKIYVQDLLY